VLGKMIFEIIRGEKVGEQDNWEYTGLTALEADLIKALTLRDPEERMTAEAACRAATRLLKDDALLFGPEREVANLEVARVHANEEETQIMNLANPVLIQQLRECLDSLAPAPTLRPIKRWEASLRLGTLRRDWISPVPGQRRHY